VNFLSKYVNRKLYYMNDHRIVVYYLIVKVLVFHLVYMDYKEPKGLDLDSMFDEVRCNFIFHLRLLIIPIDSWTANYVRIKTD
jgi:hypothetical protein